MSLGILQGVVFLGGGCKINFIDLPYTNHIKYKNEHENKRSYFGGIFMMNWKQLIGDNWNIEKLAPVIGDQWTQFVMENQKLIYRAMFNYGNSRQELERVIITYI